jgi:hypothetical protein
MREWLMMVLNGVTGTDLQYDHRCPGDNSSREVGMGNPAEEVTITRTLDSTWKWRMMSRPAVFLSFEANPGQFMDWEAAAFISSLE